jgi:multiple sugar transport system ATP-binding protein
MANLTIKNLKKSFGETEILKGINLEIKDNEFVVFVGPSGCGKSTLLRSIAGLEEVTGGHILLDTKEITDLAPAKRDLAMVFQSYALYPHMSVRKNMSFALELAKEKKEVIHNKVAEAARILELDPLLERKPKELSGGQRQRLAIARMVLSDPSVVILDEATSALDAETEFQLHQDLEAFLRQRTTLIIAHRLSAVKQADRVYVFEDGFITEEGHHDELIARQGLYAQLYGDRQA